MQPVYINDPNWLITFPHLVAPLPDEWSAGLLLRCDEANHWGSGTTFAYLHHLRRKTVKWSREANRPIPRNAYPCLTIFDYLTQLVAIPMNALLATTYYFERVKLYKRRQVPERLNPAFSFPLCPECLAEQRLLRRTLILPHITLCPQHQVALLNTCQCGTSLQLFQQVLPFTCHICGVDWADLPRIKASLERMKLEHEILCWYEFFFFNGIPMNIFHARDHFSRAPSKRGGILFEDRYKLVSSDNVDLFSIGSLAASLVEHDLFPHDFLADDGAK